MDLIVRAATTADGNGLLELLPRLAEFDLPASRNPRHLWEGDAELVRQWIDGNAPDCRVHVAVDGDTVVGLAVVTLRPELLSKAPSAHLEALAVAAGYEGRGLGYGLLAAAEKDALAGGAESMTLHVFAVNERARGLYEKAGYTGELMRYIKPLQESSDR